MTVGELADRCGMKVPKRYRGVQILPPPAAEEAPVSAEIWLTAGPVATLLGVSVQRVHQLDASLGPVRCQCGTRLYSAEAVARVDAERAVARERLREERRARSRAQLAGTYVARGTGRVKGAAARRRSSP